MSSISESLAKAESILGTNGIAEPRREAASIVVLAIEKEKTFLYAHPDYELTELETSKFETLLARRAAREPLQYISGVQEFYGLEFEVTPDVLIPRPETEMVVEHAIELLKPRPSQRLCEIGVGSGCISISIRLAGPREGDCCKIRSSNRFSKAVLPRRKKPGTAV